MPLLKTQPSDNDHQRTQSRPQPRAETRRSWWPGWIWAIPLAAVGIVAWLAIRSFATKGTEVSVTFDTAAGMKPDDTKVTYRDLNVGKLTDLAISKDGNHVVAKLDIDDSVKKFLTTGTRFWLQGGQPSLSDLSSLKSVIAGPTIVLAPGPGQPTRHFTGLDKPPTIPDWTGPRISYRIAFTGAVGGLSHGAPVELRGFTIGEVSDFNLDWDAKSETLSTPVTIALDPSRIHIDSANPAAAGNDAAALDRILERLIQQGLRARLDQKPPLVGNQIVTLDFVPDAKPADLITGGQYPEIPAENSGGIDALMAKAGAIPLDQIGNNVRQITQQLNGIVSSPEIKSSIDHLNETLASLDKTVRQTGPKIGPLVESLRRTASELQTTANAADQMMGGGASQAGNLKTAIHELTETARSIKSLANYLDEHPEAVLSGK
jgi:paraquat-inducible protein B